MGVAALVGADALVGTVAVVGAAALVGVPLGGAVLPAATDGAMEILVVLEAPSPDELVPGHSSFALTASSVKRQTASK